MNSTYSKTGIKQFIPWIILLVLVLLFDIIKVLPQTNQWLSTKKEISVISNTIQDATKEKENSEKTLDSLRVRFESEAKDYIIEESQIFPETFDAYQVSKILEIFSIQHSLLNIDSGLRLERISFAGGGAAKPGEKFIQTKVNLDFLCSEETLMRVIDYLQSGKLPEDFTDNSSLDARDIDYLRANRLPLAHIEAIRIAQASGTSPLKKASLDISFFSQK